MIFSVWIGALRSPGVARTEVDRSYGGSVMRSTLLSFLALSLSVAACAVAEPTAEAVDDLEAATRTLPLCTYYGCAKPSGSPTIYTECTNNDCWCRLPDNSLFALAYCGSATPPCFAECRLYNDTEPHGPLPP